MTEDIGKIPIGISSCLLGNQVRYNGGHQRDRYITDTLSHFFDFVPVCPEVECGLPVPRETLRLVGDPESPRLVTSKTGVDHTDRMLSWAKKRVKELEQDNLCGFIFKSKSPSSGMARVKVYGKNNTPNSVGVGMFARAFMDHFPLLPVEEEGRLHDILLRENFIESVFVYKRWRNMLTNPSPAHLVEFHTDHKMLLRSRSEKNYRELGRIVADAGSEDHEKIVTSYQEKMMATLKLKPTVNKHVNVLLHMMGFFKKILTKDEKSELLEVIENYKQHHVPLIVPITLLSHYSRKYKVEYLLNQHYLHPHPVELKLRNHA